MKKVLALLSVFCLLTLMGTGNLFANEPMDASEDENQSEQKLVLIEDDETTSAADEEMWSSFSEEYVEGDEEAQAEDFEK